jgi:hypothetical protein
LSYRRVNIIFFDTLSSPGEIDHKMDRLGSHVRYDRLCSALGAPSYPVAVLATTAWRSLGRADRDCTISRTQLRQALSIHLP